MIASWHLEHCNFHADKNNNNNNFVICYRKIYKVNMLNIYNVFYVLYDANPYLKHKTAITSNELSVTMFSWTPTLKSNIRSCIVHDTSKNTFIIVLLFPLGQVFYTRVLRPDNEGHIRVPHGWEEIGLRTHVIFYINSYSAFLRSPWYWGIRIDS
jgi:hypothetical protein